MKTLADNWSNPQFVEFVEELADIINELDITPNNSSPRFLAIQKAFMRVTELEKEFWPEEGEELVSRR